VHDTNKSESVSETKIIFFDKMTETNIFRVAHMGHHTGVHTCSVIISATRQRCAWTGFLTFWIRTPVASSRFMSVVIFPVAGSGLDFIFAEKMLLVVCLTYIYPDSNRSRIA